MMPSDASNIFSACLKLRTKLISAQRGGLDAHMGSLDQGRRIFLGMHVQIGDNSFPIPTQGNPDHSGANQSSEGCVLSASKSVHSHTKGFNPPLNPMSFA